MKLPMPVTALMTMTLLQGCATTAQRNATVSADTTAGSGAAAPILSPAVSHTLRALPIAQVTEVPVEKDAPPAQGHPLTSVVVTQCNLIVAVYLTMADGRLLRFDQSNSAQMPADQLLTMAYTATRSERVEVSCNDEGAIGYEHHDPV